MLLTVTSKTSPARDLGYLLRKHPDRFQSFELPFGKALVFYPIATDDECTIAMYLDIDPVTLVRGKPSTTDGGLVDAYVNDRPYVASSFLSVAIARVFTQGLNGKCEEPGLADKQRRFEATISPVRFDEKGLANRLFEPLGYEVQATAVDVPAEARTGMNQRVTIAATTTLQLLLNHLYVLIPVLDGFKHYWVGEEEVEKLFRFGKDWLSEHPEREFITRRYLKRAPSLAREAVARLTAADEGADPNAPRARAIAEEDALERPIRLQDRRIASVVSALKRLGAQRVIDVGCGEGDLIVALARDPQFEKIVGTDVSARELERAKARLEHVPLPTSRRESLALFQSSALYFDHRLNNADAITLIEVVEHVEPDRLDTLEHVLFGTNKPRSVVVTTPNSEYNKLFEALPAGAMRHADHRFEWSRDEFRVWAEGVASRHGYSVAFEPIGDEDAVAGAPTQMAVFQCA
jgi:3' terminal RNA ribose 2'-O-methyltransferase Hen1